MMINAVILDRLKASHQNSKIIKILEMHTFNEIDLKKISHYYKGTSLKWFFVI